MKHVGMFLALTLLPGSVEAVPRKDPVEPAVVEGVFTLHYAKRPEGEAIGEMTAMACSDGTFMIHGDGWCGTGVVERRRGAYSWRFTNGAAGMTTFVVNPDGTLSGHVLGSGLNWHYLARPVRMPVPK